MLNRVAAVAVLLTLVAACSSSEPGPERAGTAATNLTDFKKQIGDASKQIDKTVSSLNALAAVKDGNPRPAFDAYVAELAACQQTAAHTRATAEAMKAKGRGFFTDWEKDIEGIKNAELKAKAKERAAERSKDYAKIEEWMGTARGQWTTFNSDMHDLKLFLQNDLNPKGIEAASSLFKKVNLDATELRNTVTALSGQVQKVHAELAPGQ